ncbi:MAG: hypothetical protein EA355_15735 [Rhodobacteraceae bacterium]|nr:MAG: hypothetical protein EA355_15735 [Paracoccaceae bacterium]
MTDDCRDGGGRAFRLAALLGAELADLPLAEARRLLRAMAEAVDHLRVEAGAPAGMIEAVVIYETPDPACPSWLKGRDDWRRDLALAWRALPEADRRAFMRRVTKA